MKSTKDHEVISFCNKREDSTASTEVLSEVISSIFNSYTTLPVSNLLCSDDDIVFIQSSTVYGQNRIIKGKMLKTSIRSLMSLDEKIFDIELDKNGAVLFTQLSDVAESPIQMLLPSGEMKTVLDPKPMRLLALHLNKDNELICGLREQGSPLPVHEFSVRQVVVFGKDYKKKITIETDINGTKLFRYPSRIRTDSKNNIYVLDRRNTDQTGRIVATDKSGRLKFTYCGPNDFESFMPTSIVITPSDNIVLSVKSQDALLVLSSKGNLIAKQFVHELDITTPSALCIDSEDFY
ncbi:unnamed protein product [Mytilus edulis]|uniref:Uncharacterized protein n=1 Tax=Mytilus edulis TaxID=6550 RepID=A0A8S3R9J4_MYTED|nr:unnamed protein product [Mytilus edulis]